MVFSWSPPPNTPQLMPPPPLQPENPTPTTFTKILKHPSLSASLVVVNEAFHCPLTKTYDYNQFNTVENGLSEIDSLTRIVFSPTKGLRNTQRCHSSNTKEASLVQNNETWLGKKYRNIVRLLTTEGRREAREARKARRKARNAKNAKSFKGFVNDGLPNYLTYLNSDQDVDPKIEMSKAFVRKLKRIGIRCIATDFDRTMITQHSKGRLDVNKDAEVGGKNILKSLSEDFDVFGAIANEKGLKIVCVTFADSRMLDRMILTEVEREHYVAGEELVKLVMKKCGAHFLLEKCYPFYPKLYKTPEDYKSLGLKKPMEEYKSYHLKQVCKDYELKPEQILLIDDDIDNCKQAIKEGYYAITLPKGKGFDWKDVEVPDIVVPKEPDFVILEH